MCVSARVCACVCVCVCVWYHGNKEGNNFIMSWLLKEVVVKYVHVHA